MNASAVNQATVRRWPTLFMLSALGLAMLLLLGFRDGTVHFPWVLWTSLLLLPAGALAARQLIREGLAGRTLAVSGLVAGWLLLSQATSMDAAISLGTTLAALCALAALPLTMVLVRRGQALTLLALVLVVPALYAIAMGLRIEFADLEPALVRDRNVLGDSLFCALLAGLGVCAGRVPARAAALLGSGLILVVMISVVGLLGSRAVALMALVGVAGCTIWLGLSGRRDLRLLLWPLAAALGWALGNWLAGAAEMADPGLGAGAMAGAGSGSGTLARSLGVRTPLLEAALALLFEHPVTGVGLLNFHLLFEPLQQAGYYQRAAMVHNDYLQLGIELGLIATLGMLVLGALLSRELVREVARVLPRASSRDEAEPLRIALLLALLGVMAHALVNFPFYDATVLLQWTVLLGVVLAPTARVAPGRSSRLAAPALGLLALACALQVLQAGAYAVETVVLRGHSIAPGVVAAPPTRAQAYVWAERLSAWPTPGAFPEFEQGRILTALWEEGGRVDPTLAQAALERFAKAVATAPHMPEFTVQYTRLLRETGAPLAQRHALLDAVITLRPKDPLPYLAYAVHALQASDTEAAFEVAAGRWLPWCRYGDHRPAATADLLALAIMGDADPDRLATCRALLAADGIVPSTAESVLARFAPGA